MKLSKQTTSAMNKSTMETSVMIDFLKNILIILHGPLLFLYG